jgi:DNA-binding CsgD family transcriptional regulator
MTNNAGNYRLVFKFIETYTPVGFKGIRPDDPLMIELENRMELNMNVPFSDCEFEIIRLIESGLSSEQIAEKIFLSVHMVNTHRRNILNKTGKSTISELIYDLVNQDIM